MSNKVGRLLSRRRTFLKAVGFVAISAGLSLSNFLRAQVTSQNNSGPPCCLPGESFKLPGRLGNPELTLIEDPRLDPAIRAELINSSDPKHGLLPPTLTMESSYDDCIKFIEFMHKLIMDSKHDEASVREKNPDVVASTELIPREDGTEIKLFMERPKVSRGPIPCVVHLHGGGMSFSSAETFDTVNWRTKIAQQGIFVVGVEFRSEALNKGHHPFPSGLNDCATAVRWVQKNKSSLGISSLIVSGESGGGNLAIGLGIKAKIEGWVDLIDGIYAIAPMVIGVYENKVPNLSSWKENMGYQGTMPIYRAMTKVYDPQSIYKNDPRAWPFCASPSILRGLPPHTIVNYELDLIRDDGVVFAQRLRAAGVSANSIIINGAHHVPDIAMPDAVPEMTRASIASIAAFVKSC